MAQVLYIYWRIIFRVNNEANSENIITADANGSVGLYYDNDKKLETKSTGVGVTGNLSTTVSASIGTTGLQSGNVLSVKGSTNNQINIARSANNSWGLLLTNSQPSSGYHATQIQVLINHVQSLMFKVTLYTLVLVQCKMDIDHSGEFYPVHQIVSS